MDEPKNFISSESNKSPVIMQKSFINRFSLIVYFITTCSTISHLTQK